MQRRARDEHVEEEGGLGRRRRDERQEARAVAGDDRCRQLVDEELAGRAPRRCPPAASGRPARRRARRPGRRSRAARGPCAGAPGTPGHHELGHGLVVFEHPRARIQVSGLPGAPGWPRPAGVPVPRPPRARLATSCRVAPVSPRRGTTSSNSGLARPRPTFMRTVMPSTVTSSSSRAAGQRSTGGGVDPHRPGHPPRSRPGARRRAPVGQHVQDVARPPFFMVTAADPGVERAGVEGGGHCVAQLLARDIVEVGLEHQRGRPGPTDSPWRGARSRPGCNWAGRRSRRAAAEPRRGDGHVRHRSERGAERGHERGAGWRGELDVDVAAVASVSPRAGARSPGPGWAAGRVRCAPSRSPWPRPRPLDLVHTEHFERSRRPNDVDDRIVPADLVKVDLVEGSPVQARHSTEASRRKTSSARLATRGGSAAPR